MTILELIIGIMAAIFGSGILEMILGLFTG